MQVIINYYLYKCILMKSNYNVFNLTNIYIYIFNIGGMPSRSHCDYGRSCFLVEKMSIIPIE